MLNTQYFGKSIIRLEETDSTNQFLHRILKDRPVEGTTVVADYQFAGKGQAQNVWESDKGQNLTFSVLLYPKFLAIYDLFYLNKITSIAMKNTVQEFLPNDIVEIKWPNDILVKKKKIGGILIENAIEKQLQSSVVGIGLNVNQVHFSSLISHKTTSIRKLTEKHFELSEVLEKFLYHFEQYYLLLKSCFWDRIDREYLQNLYGYQEAGTFLVHNVEIPGMIIGVHKDGRLSVQHENTLTSYHFKEIEFVL